MKHQTRARLPRDRGPRPRPSSRPPSPTSSASRPATRRRPAPSPGATTPRPSGSSSARDRPTTPSPSASRPSTPPPSTPSSSGSAAQGHDVADDPDLAGRAPGRAARSASPRRGAPTSRSCSGRPTAEPPFSSTLVPGGFLTEGVGFGHVVLATTAFDESVALRSPTGLGLHPVGLAGDGDRRGHRARGAVLPLQRPAPHRRPGPGPVRAAPDAAPRHVRDERPRRRRRRLRPAVGHRPRHPQRARPPRQRRHVQLLPPDPGRLPDRGRPRRPASSPTTGTTTAATTPSAPGATSPCAP